MMHLVLGGERSGKSNFGLQWLAQSAMPRCCVVTGQPLDLGFRRQVRDHRMARPVDLPVFESGLDLLACLRNALDREYSSILLDSLDFWLFSCLSQDSGERLEAFTEGLRDLNHDLDEVSANLCMVSSEIGLGPIAADSATRAFARRLGGLHQQLAAMCDTVTLVLAGTPLSAKGGDPTLRVWHQHDF